MRAAEPTLEGDVVRDGVRTHYEVHGAGEHTILLLPTWSLFHARHWKAQIAYLARHFRVIVVDGRGNGRSDRPRGADAYRDEAFLGDVLAVLDATATRQALVAGLSLGGHLAAMLAALHPDRVAGAVLICPSSPYGPRIPERARARALERRDAYDGWDKYNVHHWRENYRDFVEFFVANIFVEPHSTKQIEDAVGWALETTGDVIADTALSDGLTADEAMQLYRRVRCPTLVIVGDKDRISHPAVGPALAEATGGELYTIEGAGHGPIGRYPVLVNRLIKEHADRVWGLRPMQRRSVPRRPRRALYLSSPIGLGHARRDLAVARAVRESRPDLELHWLTQDPVAQFLASEGESIHPASRALRSESSHIEAASGEHDLHVFQALRDMDEIMVANFMVFQEVVEDGHYDLVIADEAWEVDQFWHEHPELKRAPLAWLTDFVGFLPFDDGGDRERRLTADYNAEMIEHVERFPWVRDRSLFVGRPEDIVPDRFGPDLPAIRAWTERHFRFTGYISGLDLAALGEPAALRDELGYAGDEQVCIVTVGGSAVGEPLLRRVIDAVPLARRHVPALRVVVVTGPRIDSARLAARLPAGVELRGNVRDLPRHLACCDLGIVQGGLTTCMELACARKPFLYVPIAHHFEQCFHVDHRLRRLGAGRRLDYATAEPDALAAAIVDELRRPARWAPVEHDGARRAADLLVEML